MDLTHYHVRSIARCGKRQDLCSGKNLIGQVSDECSTHRHPKAFGVREDSGPRPRAPEGVDQDQQTTSDAVAQSPKLMELQQILLNLPRIFSGVTNRCEIFA